MSHVVSRPTLMKLERGKRPPFFRARPWSRGFICLRPCRMGPILYRERLLGAKMHSAVTVVALPAAKKHDVVVVAGHVASESNIAHGPLIIIDVVDEQVVEVLVQPLLPGRLDLHEQSGRCCASAATFRYSGR